MAHKLSCDSHIFAFSGGNAPAINVKSGETIEIQTMDCFANQLKTENDKLGAIDWNRVNPATGPVYVETAEPGDTLKVTINKIEIADTGITATGENEGVLGDILKGLTTKFIPVKGEKIFFNNIEMPLRKMIGVIGVAPQGEAVNCGTPGPHGGNMDNTMVGEGASIYFPVAVKGALFAAGDVHAAMGDGEIGVSGVEIPAVVTVTLEVLKDMKIHNPYLENEKYISTIASDKDLESAVSQAVHDMGEILKDKLPMTMDEIAMLCSVAGNVEVCQVVDPLRTARFTFPKIVLEKARQ